MPLNKRKKKEHDFLNNCTYSDQDNKLGMLINIEWINRWSFYLENNNAKDPEEIDNIDLE